MAANAADDKFADEHVNEEEYEEEDEVGEEEEDMLSKRTASVRVKQQLPTPTRLSAAARTTKTRRAPINVALAAQVTEHELFVQKKRGEATLRDITGKAVCAIKHALRQSGAQADGRPAIPASWNDIFKPQLGSFMKFVLGRPDQFRVVEGAKPGFYTVENIAGNKTVVAPSWDQKAKGKGQPFVKGKPWGKLAKGKGKFENGEGKGKSENGKGKFENGKGKTKQGNGKGPGVSETHADTVEEPFTKQVAPPNVATEHRKILPRAARLLAAAAKSELAEEEDTGGAAEEQPEEMQDAGDEEGDDSLGWAEDAAGEEMDDDNEDEEPSPKEAEDMAEDDGNGENDDFNSSVLDAANRGSYIKNLLSSSPFGGPASRKRVKTSH